MNIDAPQVIVPHIDQWLGIWAMREREFMATAEIVRSLNLSLHLAGPAPQAAREQAARGPMTTGDAVAVLEMRGRMSKQQASMGESASTVALRQAIRAAAANPDVGSILMVIDSPGGTVAGTKELADDVAAAAGKKPVIALIEDIGASAAYWVASQATQILAQATAAVGSIGTYGVVVDSSRAAANEGYEVHVIRAGNHKGAGTPGAPITQEQLDQFQAEVDALNEFFVAGVASGRELSAEQVKALATGQVWIGQQAQAVGLIDGIATFDQALATAQSAAATNQKGRPSMAAATYQEIVAACPGAGPEFICDQLKSGHTVEQSVKDFMAHQQLQIEQTRKERDTFKARADAADDEKKKEEEEEKKKEDDEAKAKARGKTLGVDPLKQTGGRETDAGSSFEDFQAAVEAKVAKGMNRQKAVAATVRENPDRHAAVIDEANAGRRKRA